MALTFSVTWDYRCPYARIAHEHVVTGLEGGADWDVTFVPFSLDQCHVPEDAAPVWDRPGAFPALLALGAGVVVRDRQPERFLAVHRALFDARHLHAQDLRDREVLSEVLDGSGVDGTAVLAEVDEGWPLKVVRAEHEEAAGTHKVWGVPTFIVDDQAVFVRLLHASDRDAGLATSTVQRVVDLAGGWPDLNEFKHTSIPR